MNHLYCQLIKHPFNNIWTVLQTTIWLSLRVFHSRWKVNIVRKVFRAATSKNPICSDHLLKEQRENLSAYNATLFKLNNSWKVMLNWTSSNREAIAFAVFFHLHLHQLYYSCDKCSALFVALWKPFIQINCDILWIAIHANCSFMRIVCCLLFDIKEPSKRQPILRNPRFSLLNIHF